MKRFRDLAGLPVVLKQGGRVIGRVKLVDYTPGDERISGLIVDRGGLKRAGYLKWEMISAIGDKSVVALTDKLSQPPKMQGGRTRPRAYMPDGTEAGIVTDFHLDERSGVVSMVEVGHSLAEDLLYGRKDVSHFALMEFSKDMMIWPDEGYHEETKT